jgi:hypothetical protein
MGTACVCLAKVKEAYCAFTMDIGAPSTSLSVHDVWSIHSWQETQRHIFLGGVSCTQMLEGVCA